MIQKTEAFKVGGYLFPTETEARNFEMATKLQEIIVRVWGKVPDEIIKSVMLVTSSDMNIDKMKRTIDAVEEAEIKFIQAEQPKIIQRPK